MEQIARFVSACQVLAHPEIGQATFCEHLSLAILKSVHPNTEVHFTIFKPPIVNCGACGEEVELAVQEEEDVLSQDFGSGYEDDFYDEDLDEDDDESDWNWD